jgi:hypothetical protein
MRRPLLPRLDDGVVHVTAGLPLMLDLAAMVVALRAGFECLRWRVRNMSFSPAIIGGTFPSSRWTQRQ